MNDQDIIWKDRQIERHLNPDQFRRIRFSKVRGGYILRDGMDEIIPTPKDDGYDLSAIGRFVEPTLIISFCLCVVVAAIIAAPVLFVVVVIHEVRERIDMIVGRYRKEK
jgi:UDP-N-acetylglucosamine:LPS N-acetylglucosamine transferase